MWYEKSYRRHLCDMHIEDWDESFLSKFSPEVYVENLKRAKLDNAMIYLQSHVGLCYFPTKIGKMHNAFIGREDMMRTLVDLCHKNGITVTGYYSLIYNTFEHDRHPEWRMIQRNGKSSRAGENTGIIQEFGESSATSRYGLVCPNNPDYRKFVEAQIREMAEYFPSVDGMFYDMLFWPHFCYCEHCRARWAREVGGEIPTTDDTADKEWLIFNDKRRVWMGEFAAWVTKLTKEIFGRNISVEHNVSRAASSNKEDGNAEEVLAACDYAGGDRYVTPYNQSFTCKFYRSITKNQPFEFMFSRCAPKLSTHTQIKSYDTVMSATALTSAHHGATLIIDAIDPVGTMDSRVYDRIGEVFSAVMPYEKYYTGTPVADVGIYYSLKSKFASKGEVCTTYEAMENSAIAMIKENVLFDITGGFNSLENFKAIILPIPTSEDEYDTERIVNYVKNGGKLYFSGSASPSLLREFFGAEVAGRTEESVVYISPKKKIEAAFDYFNEDRPITFEGTAPVIKNFAECDVAATLTLPYTKQNTSKFASIHSNPPGIKTDIPAILFKSFGKGKVIWSGLPLEAVKLYDYRRILKALVMDILGVESTLVSDAPYEVEVTLFRDGEDYLVSTVQLNDEYKARRLADFTVKIKLDSEPKELLYLPSEESVPFEYDGKYISFTVASPKILEMYKIVK